MNTIYKYQITDRIVHHNIPLDSEFLCVQAQNGVGCMWFGVDDDLPKTSRAFAIVGTGQSIDFNNGEYLGTYQLGQYVLHVFELL
jgi:hypothetical protein